MSRRTAGLRLRRLQHGAGAEDAVEQQRLVRVRGGGLVLVLGRVGGVGLGFSLTLGYP